MADVTMISQRAEAQYSGLRMSADEFFNLPEDGYDYELIDGVVLMSPSPKPLHQAVLTEILVQIGTYLRQHAVGRVFPELGVHLGQGPTGGDLVYKPELIFIRAERLSGMPDRIMGPPDLVVEVISPGSRRLDTETKKSDYERCGVHEYWLFDPERQTVTFYRRQNDRFVDASPGGDTFASQAVPGFELDITRIKAEFDPS